MANAFVYVPFPNTHRLPLPFLPLPLHPPLTPPSGFAFALNNWRNLILAILLIVLVAVSATLALNRFRQNRRARNNRSSSPVFGFSSGPKGPDEPYADDGAGVGLREYAPSPAQIGLMDVSGGANLGPVQKGREFI